jgi:hypothetical protein
MIVDSVSWVCKAEEKTMIHLLHLLYHQQLPYAQFLIWSMFVHIVQEPNVSRKFSLERRTGLRIYTKLVCKDLTLLEDGS